MAYDFVFFSGDASLDLVNTLMHRHSPNGPDELLNSGEDVQRWFVHAGLVTQDEAEQLDPDTTLHVARRLRTALDAVYRPLALGEDDPAGTERGLTTLNAVLNQGRDQIQVARTSAGFARKTQLEMLGPLDPNVRVARRAADLLHRLEPDRLRECANPECDLMFYDESRNNSRRWCSMQGCGNVHKQARFRRAARTRGEPETGRAGAPAHRSKAGN